MSGFRPYNRLPIATHHHEEPLTDGRRTIITGTQLAILNGIAQTFYQSRGILTIQRNIQKFAAFSQRWMFRWDPGCQHTDKCPECFADAVWIRAHFCRKQRPPCFKLFNVLQHQNPRFNIQRPAQNNPGQPANRLFYRLGPFRL